MEVINSTCIVDNPSILPLAFVLAVLTDKLESSVLALALGVKSLLTSLE